MGACSDGGLRTLLILVLAAALARPVRSVGSCKVKLCSRQYARDIERDSVLRGPTYRFCTILRNYADCIRATARGCRGDLEYHSISSLVMQWINGYNCTHVINRGPQQEPNSYSSKNSPSGYRPYRPKTSSAMGECLVYRPPSGAVAAFSHCGLFGDPHLRTFYNELQTCRVKGAWPLIDNPFLAVQVTNDAVIKGASATATSKVTVIVREHGPCAREKTYEAQTDYLPAVFVDGSKTGGPGVRIKEESPGQHVEILLQYIGTRLVIRQVGRYLTFAVRMPREIAIQGAQSEALELCVRGCPRRERIDFNQLLAEPDQFISMVTSRGHVAIPKKEALATCRQYNVTDFYFDACVFDLLTTGDSTFSLAAREAMNDVLTLHPASASSRQNRTYLLPAAAGTHHQKDALLPENSAPGRTPQQGLLLTITCLVVLLLACR